MKYRTLPGTDSRRLGGLPRHDDLGRAEQRSRSARATRLRGRAGHQLHRHGRDVSGAAERAGRRGAPRRSSATGSRASRATGLVVATKVAGPGPPRLDSRRPHRSDARRHRRGGATRASRGCRSTTSTSTRSTGRSATCRCSARPSSIPRRSARVPSIDEQVEGMAALIKAGKIRHYGLSNETPWGVCEFHRVARGARRAGSGHAAEQLQPRVAQRRQRPRRGAAIARRCRCSPTARSPPAYLSGKYLDGAQPPNARLHAVRRYRRALPQADGAARRSMRMRSSRSGAGSRWCSSRWATSRAAGSRRDDHRRDVDGAARRGHRRRAIRARCGDARRHRDDPPALSRIRQADGCVGHVLRDSSRDGEQYTQGRATMGRLPATLALWDVCGCAWVPYRSRMAASKERTRATRSTFPRAAHSSPAGR